MMMKTHWRLNILQSLEQWAPWKILFEGGYQSMGNRGQNPCIWIIRNSAAGNIGNLPRQISGLQTHTPWGKGAENQTICNFVISFHFWLYHGHLFMSFFSDISDSQGEERSYQNQTTQVLLQATPMYLSVRNQVREKNHFQGLKTEWIQHEN